VPPDTRHPAKDEHPQYDTNKAKRLIINREFGKRKPQKASAVLTEAFRDGVPFFSENLKFFADTVDAPDFLLLTYLLIKTDAWTVI